MMGLVMPSAFLQFFIYLEDQTDKMDADQLGPVSVEFYERKIDGGDELLQVRVEGTGALAASLAVSGATQSFAGEDPLRNIAGAAGGSGILEARWKPWAEVWTEHVP